MKRGEGGGGAGEVGRGEGKGWLKKETKIIIINICFLKADKGTFILDYRPHLAVIIPVAKTNSPVVD